MKILFLTVGVLFIISLIGAGVITISQDVQAGVPAEEPNFQFIDLTISPKEVDIGQIVTISTLVINRGDLDGSLEVMLEIDGVVEATEKITLDILETEEVVFTISKDVAGTYSVAVDGRGFGSPIVPVEAGLTGSFTVRREGSDGVLPIVYGIVAAVVVVLWLVSFLIRRRGKAG